MKKFTKEELLLIKENIFSKGGSKADLDIINEMLMEDTSATGGPGGGEVSGSGMGDVTSAQPSSMPGSLTGPSWSENGGTVGSGDVSFPWNPGTGVGKKYIFRKEKAFGRSHGAGTGKKIRHGKMLATIRSKSPRTSKGKILDFDSFSRDEFSKVTKVKE